ncbi:MAG: hypothetical protein JSS20_10770 [Proteobacteria bacterium]|nr:hypothetical protein [Pseudomonadota bacterium]
MQAEREAALKNIEALKRVRDEVRPQMRDPRELDELNGRHIRAAARQASRPQRQLKFGERDFRDLLKLLGCPSHEIDVAVQHGPLAVVIMRDVIRRLPREHADRKYRAIVTACCLAECKAGVDVDSADAILSEIASRLAEHTP